MVKVLMVHGSGVNAAIFEAQTAPLRALLPSHWEYHFLQGPLECGPAPGVGEFYPGQTYSCWFHVPSLIEIRSVHELLEEVIEEEGPFDVAWGFSAGAMIINSLLLRSAYESPHSPQPFRAAIFMNSYMPWSAIKDLGRDVTPLVIQQQHVPCTLVEADRMLARGFQMHPTKEHILKDKRDANLSDDDLITFMMRNAYQNIHSQDLERGLDRKYDDLVAHRMFSEVDKVRVPIPTGHILGDKDPLKDSSAAMCKMCDPRVMLTYKHDFGHEIPTRSPKDLRKIREVVEKTVIRSEFI